MDDNKLESFFNGMKAADRHLPIPPFEKPKGPRKLLPLFMYAAAAAVTLLMAVLYFTPEPGNDVMPAPDIVILIGQDNLKSQSLMEDTGPEELSDWESPTSFLSEDY